MATAAFTTSRATALLLTCLALSGCGGGGAAVTTPGEAPAVAALRIDPPSTSLPVGGTVRLSGVATDGSGNPLSGLPAPVFVSGDPGRASVTPDGMVTGRAAGQVTITATLVAAGVTRTASATVLVTAAAAPGAPATPPATPPPAAPSTATVDAGDHAFSPSTVTIAAGGTVTWRMVDDEHDITWTGPAPAGGNIPKTDEGVSVSRTFSTPGTYTYRCARHESKGKTGTVVVTGQGSTPANPPATPPPSGSTATVTTPGESFSPATVTIARGGTVSWEISGATHNVTFQGAAPTGGNVPDTRSGTVSRTFPTAGSYPYSCTRHSGMNGSVVVQ
jgi:plastocyanin